MKIGNHYVIEVIPKAELIFIGQLVMGGVGGEEDHGSVTMYVFPFVVFKKVVGTEKMVVSYSFDVGNKRIIDIQANKKNDVCQN